jgi:peptidoglycan/xylan/chitin deacetylase (PgdA/CDA1 family)
MPRLARALAPAILIALAGLTPRASALQPRVQGLPFALSAGTAPEEARRSPSGEEFHFPEELAFGIPSSFLAPRPLPDLGDRAYVLCWHSFLGRPDIPTDFSVAELGKQLDALLALGYRFVSLEDLLFGRIEGCRNLVATLDDGHRTVTSAFLKAFSSRGILPALFIYPSVIGTTSYSMNEAQLRSLRDSGCLIAAHGYYHLYVTDELYRNDHPLFEKEIFTAKTRVETLAELPVFVYGYPFGAFSPITKTEVARAGYAFAFAVKDGFVFADPRLNDPYELPRSVVTRANWGELYAFLARNAGK